MNQQRQFALDYLREENRILKEQLRGMRVRLNDDQRPRLASKAKRVGHQLLAQVATKATPETLLAWHRKLLPIPVCLRTRTPLNPETAEEETITRVFGPQA
jgi:hypothetical protein